MRAAVPKCSLSVLVIVVSAVSVQAQTPYAPLEVGNEWTYYTLIDPPDEPIDTLDAGTYSVTDAMQIDGRAYYRFQHPEGRADTIYVDASERVWARIRGEDVLYFDFSVADGSSYSFTGDPDFDYTVTVRKDRTVQTHAGTFDNAVTFSFTAEGVMDADRQFTFAPGVGIVHAVGGMGETAWLRSAKIGGQDIPSSIGTPEHPDKRILEIYPNPAAGTTTLTFELENAAHVTVDVFNVSGRKITTLVERVLASGRHEIPWSAQRSATGVYFVVLQSNGPPASVSRTRADAPQLQTNGQRVVRPVILTN